MQEQKCWIFGSQFFAIDPNLQVSTKDSIFWLEGSSLNFIFIRKYLGKAIGLF